VERPKRKTTPSVTRNKNTKEARSVRSSRQRNSGGVAASWRLNVYGQFKLETGHPRKVIDASSLRSWFLWNVGCHHSIVGQIHRRRAGNLLLLFCRTHEYILRLRRRRWAGWVFYSAVVAAAAAAGGHQLVSYSFVQTSLVAKQTWPNTHTAHAPDFSHVANVRILFWLLLDLLQLSKIPFFSFLL
jgi:hypothetical protein